MEHKDALEKKKKKMKRCFRLPCTSEVEKPPKSETEMLSSIQQEV